jgi:hypothetical protein
VPKQINTPLPGAALVRQFALKGRFQPVLDETIVPVVLVPSDVPEKRRLYAFGVSLAAAGVGNQNTIQLRNPADSGVLCVLTRFWALSSAVTDTVEMKIQETTSGFAGIGGSRDARIGAPVCRTGGGAATTAVLTFPQYPCENVLHPCEWLILPGWIIQWRQATANKTLQINMEWFEISLSGGAVL